MVLPDRSTIFPIGLVRVFPAGEETYVAFNSFLFGYPEILSTDGVMVKVGAVVVVETTVNV